MAHTETTITAPVSIADVQAVLGDTSKDLETLCNSDKINWYNLYRPTTEEYKGILTKPQLAALNAYLLFDFNNQEPDTVDDVPSEKSIDELKQLTYYDDGFEYSSPYYRLLDFDGYQTDPQYGFKVDVNFKVTSTLQANNVKLVGNNDLSNNFLNAMFDSFGKQNYSCKVIFLANTNGVNVTASKIESDSTSTTDIFAWAPSISGYKAVISAYIKIKYTADFSEVDDEDPYQDVERIIFLPNLKFARYKSKI